MSGLACNFCSHGNPEGSKFCNECGSPLHLTLCSRCEAINPVSAKICYQCDAPLSSGDPEQIAVPPTELTEIAQGAEKAPTRDDAVPISLAEYLEDPRAISHESQTTSHDGRATYAGRNPNRALWFFLVVALVVVAGAAYWMSVDPTHWLDLRTMIGGAGTAAPEPASSAPNAPAQNADTPSRPPPGDSLPSAGPLPSSAGSSESPATVGESISPSADVQPPTAEHASESADTQAPFPAGAAESTNRRAAGTTPRPATSGRTKDQAERDAIATRRLIEREVVDSPPAN
jgi:hypothetical protein